MIDPDGLDSWGTCHCPRCRKRMRRLVKAYLNLWKNPRSTMDIDHILRGIAPAFSTALPGFVGITFAIENGFLFVYQRLEPYVVRRPKDWDKPKVPRMPMPMVDGDTWKGQGEEEEIEMVDVTLQRIRMTVKFCGDHKALAVAMQESDAEREKIKAWERERRKNEGNHGGGHFAVPMGY